MEIWEMNKTQKDNHKFQIVHKVGNDIIRETCNQYSKYLYEITDSRPMRNKLRREIQETGTVIYNGYIISRINREELQIHDGFPPAIPKKNKNSTWIITNTHTNVTREISNLSEFLRRIGCIYETKKELAHVYSLLKQGSIATLDHFKIKRINRTTDGMLDPYAALLSEMKSKAKNSKN